MSTPHNEHPLGRPRRNKKKRSAVFIVIVISIAVHVLAGGALAIIKIVEAVNDEPDFEAPPIVQAEAPPPPPPPPPTARQTQRSMPRPQPLAAQNPQNMDVPAITIDSSSLNMVTGRGTGGGLGAVGGGTINNKLKNFQFPEIDGFGTTDPMDYAWEGTVYLFKPDKIRRLLDKDKEEVVGLKEGKRQSAKIYNHVINLPRQDFSEGFPGVTDQFEWFAIDFEVKLQWPESLAGEYEFRITSDDGSVLLINRDLVVDNDGSHAMKPSEGSYTMKAGTLRMQLSYFQGPAKQLGLILEYRKAGAEEWQLFDLKEYIQYQPN